MTHTSEASETIEHLKRLGAVVAVALLAGGIYWLFHRPHNRSGDIGPLSSSCQKVPAFAKDNGIAQPVFDTSKKGTPGLVVYDLNHKDKVFQNSTWKTAGNLGPIANDEAGNLYVAPVPNINTLDNPPSKQNTIYEVDNDSGDMSEYYSLTNVPTPNQDNPYGLLSLAYDCETSVLYASSISGSTENDTKGVIVAIDTRTKQEIARIKGYDALSVGLFRDKKGAELYFGLANRSQVWRVGLSDSGSFVGKPSQVLSYDNFNELKPRKLDFTGTKTLSIHTTEFRYNLIASTEFRQDIVKYTYNSGNDSWQKVPVDVP